MSPSKSDTRRIYALRSLRAFGFGYLAVLLPLDLGRFGFGAAAVGGYLSLATLGGLLLNLLLARRADRSGRRRTLAIASGLLAAAGTLLALAQGPVLLLVAAICGTVPPGGNGLFSAVEQGMLGGHAGQRRTSVFALYGFLGSGATAAGSLAAALPDLLAAHGVGVMAAFRLMFALYAAIGLGCVVLSLRLGPEVEAAGAEQAAQRSFFGLGRSHGLMVRMAALFVADAFGGSLVTTSLLVFWLHARFGMTASSLAALFAGVQVLAAASLLLAPLVAKRIGLINTAVWTHIPSSLLLMGVPLVGAAAPAAALLLARGLLVEMDIPTRQSYIAAVVDPEERAAAAGVTTMGRQVGQLLGPAVGGLALAAGALVPFLLAGAIKIGYDLSLWRLFRGIPERS